MRKNSENRFREEVDRLGRPTIEMLNREIARQERKESYIRLICGALTSFIAAVAVIIIITNLWVAVLQIDGSSMNPLLQMDEIVLAVRTNLPATNDVIAFEHSGKVYIKRVIAMGGDTVDVREDGKVTVNGKTLDEPYVTELSLGSCDIDLPYQVPSETVFVLGDNRPLALDSRDSRFGIVGREQIIGKIKFRAFPLSRFGSV